MTAEAFQRKLNAILSADAKGYSRLMGEDEEAIQKFRQALKHLPDYLPAHAYLAVIYSELGRHEETRVEASEVGRLSAQSSLESWKERLPYKNQEILERIIDGLSKAGLK
ncbi:MAG: hypothetical protein GTN81_09545 [Proteobacteria bacterium]|nr:hypothetical protein [Pseudomonadota bacterium]